MKNVLLLPLIILIASPVLVGQSLWDSTGTTIYYNSGNVGIGTISPSDKFHVVGTIRSSGAITNLDMTNDIGQQLELGTAAVSTLRFDSNDWRIFAGGTGAIGEVFRISETGEADFSGSLSVGISTHNLLVQHSIVSDYNILRFTATNAGDDNYLISYGSNNNLAPYQLALKSNQGTNSSLGFYTDNNERIRVDDEGNVGIGTASPSYLLDVNGSVGIIGALEINPTKNYQTYGAFTSSSAIAFSDGFFETVEYLGNQGLTIGSNVIRRGGGSREVIKNGDAKELALTSSGSFVFRNVLDATAGDLVGGGTYVDRFVVTRTGEMGIGTSSPTHKLEVNGTIRSKEVIVEATSWPDYVFNPEYKLRTLEEIEAYIKEKGHLPEVPSAEGVEEEGQHLGEMQQLLLKKIEELTLYAINQEKVITTQHELLNKQQELIDEITSRLEQLESKN